MPSTFLPVDPCVIKENPFHLIANEWMLITAGDSKSFNTMTASWGAMGELWNRKIAVCFVRPVRHTYRFMEQADVFTLSFFDEAHREALKFCGSHSGRDTDKIAQTGLTPVPTESGGVYFAQARLVLECRKIYFQDITPTNFLDATIDQEYPKKDYHRMYIGQIIRCLVRKGGESGAAG
jgi:flavin reductase (DIM6/NTAB) family NADH-FMN oxidoreductase RutF